MPALTGDLTSLVVVARLLARACVLVVACAAAAVAEPEPGREAGASADTSEGQGIHSLEPLTPGSAGERARRHVKRSNTAGSGRPALSGMASVYGSGRHRGSRTASGERVQPGQLTAAHRSLPFGTAVRVTNLRNGRSVVVRINDRGPFVRGRVIDVTPAAARLLGFSGVAAVSLMVVAATAP